MKSIKYNYYNIMNIQPRYYLVLIFIILLEFIIFSYVLFIQLYSKRTYYGIYQGNCLYTNIDVDNADTIIHGDYLKINNKIYEYKINSISELKVDETRLINYQEYELVVNDSFKENQVIKITIYYNKERLIDKISRLFFRKE